MGKGLRKLRRERERERWKKRRGKETAVAVDSEKLRIQGRNITIIVDESGVVLICYDGV